MVGCPAHFVIEVWVLYLLTAGCEQTAVLSALCATCRPTRASTR
jgi:hypothetical protein